MTTAPLQPLTDTAPADWLAGSLGSDERTIRPFVPTIYRAYVQISFASTERPLPMGDLDASVAALLAGALAPFTPPGQCFFATWEGYAPAFRGAPTVTFPPQREMHVFAGTLADATSPLDGILPLRWWPADHAWCVGGYMYGSSLYVGGAPEVIEAILATSGLDARGIDASHERTAEYE